MARSFRIERRRTMTRAYKISCLPEGYCKLSIAARNYLSDR